MKAARRITNALHQHGSYITKARYKYIISQMLLFVKFFLQLSQKLVRDDIHQFVGNIYLLANRLTLNGFLDFFLGKCSR